MKSGLIVVLVCCGFSTAHAAGLTVFDNTGKIIGPYIEQSTNYLPPPRVVVTDENGQLISLPFSPSGFTPSSYTYYFKSRSCAGVKLLPMTYAFVPGTIFNGIVIYRGPTSALSTLTVNNDATNATAHSIGYYRADGSFIICSTDQNYPGSYGTPKYIYLTSFGRFVPPFAVKIPP